MAANSFGPRYEVLRRVGAGGMGEVYLVRDLAAGRTCALKRLKPGARIRRAALRREFETLTRLRHPAIVAVYDFAIAPDGAPFFTMEFLPGGTPAVRAGDWRSLLAVGAEIANGLEALHAQGIVHGDLKPSNVLTASPDQPTGSIPSLRLVDFGLAAVLGEATMTPGGTSGFTAPEVVRGDPPAVSSDLYALGATLFTLACDCQPFGKNGGAILREQRISGVDRRPLEERGAPRALIDLILQLLATDARERPQTARDVRRELESIDPSIRRSLADRVGNATLVGRERELAVIEAHLGRKLPQSRVVIVRGVAGIGRSAFLAEVATRATLAGHSVICLSGPTLAPVAAALRSLGRPESEDAGLSLDERLGEELQRMKAGRPARSAVYLVDTPPVLDAASRRFMRRVLLDPGIGPTLWVMSRDAAAVEPDDERALSDAGLVQVLPLDPLDEDGARQLLATRLREVPSRRLMEFAWRLGRGHPGLTVEALKLAATSGALRESDAGLVVDGEALKHVNIHLASQTVAALGIETLSTDARRVLHILGVLQLATAEQLSQVDGTVDHLALNRLRTLGLVREGADGRFALTTPFEPESLDPAEVRQLHERALALEGLLPAERFRHLRGAGDATGALEAARIVVELAPDPDVLAAAAEVAEEVGGLEAARWHEQTAQQLFKQGQYKPAVPHLDRALVLDPHSERRAERLCLLSSAHLRLGDVARARQTVAGALAADPPPALQSRLLTNECACLMSLGDYDRAANEGERALQAGRAGADREAESLAAQTLGYLRLELGENEKAAEMAEVATQACRNDGSGFVRARAGGLQAAVARARRRTDEALEHYRTALALARNQGVRVVVEELLINRGVVHSELGRWRECREANAEALRLALEDYRPRNAAVAMANLAHADALTGQVRRARREARAAVRLARQHLPAVESSAYRALAHAERANGNLPSAERAARRALELATERGSADEVGWSRLEYGRVRAMSGHWDEALTVWHCGLDELPEGAAVLVCHLVASVGEAALHLNDLERAAAAEGRVEGLLSEASISPNARASGLRLKAGLAIRQGRLDEGVRLGVEALDVLKHIPAPAEYAATAVELTGAILERPDAHLAPVRGWLEEAADARERLGDYRGREQALQHLVRWFGRRSEALLGGRPRREIFDAVSDLLGSLSRLPEFAERAIQLVVEELSAERGVFLVVDPESGRLASLAHHGSLDAAARRRAVGYSRQVVERVRKSGEGVVIGDATLDPRARSESVKQYELRSIICMPLSAGGRVVGAVYLDDSRRAEAFGESERELLEGVANLLAVAVDRSLGQQEMERTNATLIGENRTLRREVATRFRVQELVGTSLALQRILPVIERAAESSATVLLTGESGTGKELIAHIIHSNGPRRLRSFLPINCGAITDSLLESELFGIRPNIATGVQGREGLLRQADGGTLFFDEIGDLPLKHQVALLSALSNREIIPVGGDKPIPFDVRIIAATNRDLRRMIDERLFREELYYRLHVIQIEVPPLRDRIADIPALTRHFVAQMAAREKREVPELSKDFLTVVMRSRWPGNVREFQNYIERVMAMNPGRVLHPRPLPEDLENRAGPIRPGTLTEELEHLERQRILEALERSDWNQAQAARELGIDEAGLRRRIKKHGLLAGGRNRRTGRPRRNRP